MNPRGVPQETLLVVEDDILQLELLTQALRLAAPEWLIVGSQSGREAMELLQQRTFDLLITDLRMPEPDGFDLLALAREIHPDLPAVVVTGHGIAGPDDLAREFGTRRVFDKPLDFDALFFAVQQILAAARRAESVVTGFSLPGFLQLMELDRKTARLRILSQGHEGSIVFEAGVLVHARTAKNTGDEAVYEILSWSAPEIRVANASEPELVNVTSSLSSLLLEGCRVLDETRTEAAS